MKGVKGLFDSPTDDDYQKPVIINGAFNNNYIQYESKRNKDKISTIDKYLDMIRPYLWNITNDHKTQGESKIQLIVAINFKSSKPGSSEIRTIHAESDNVEVMMGSERDEIIEDLFKSLLERYQEGLEESMKGSHFTFDGVRVLCYDLHKIILNRVKSYTDSPKWLKNKKATINPKNNDDKCFQYAITAILNYEQIKKNPQRVSNIRPFIAQYNWKEIDFLSHKKDWKEFESNKKSIAFNILYVPRLKR